MDEEFEKQLEDIRKEAMLRNAEAKMIQAEHEFLLMKIKFGIIQCESILNPSKETRKK